MLDTGTLHILTNLILNNPLRLSLIPILLLWKQRHSAAKHLVQGYPVKKGKSPDSKWAVWLSSLLSCTGTY